VVKVIVIFATYGALVRLIKKGVCMYEFLCGGVPYGEELDDPFDI
jgi:cGMP-dependent protein kinase